MFFVLCTSFRVWRIAPFMFSIGCNSVGDIFLRMPFKYICRLCFYSFDRFKMCPFLILKRAEIAVTGWIWMGGGGVERGCCSTGIRFLARNYFANASACCCCCCCCYIFDLQKYLWEVEEGWRWNIFRLLLNIFLPKGCARSPAGGSIRVLTRR